VKKLIFLIIGISLFFIGCQQSNSSTEEVNNHPLKPNVIIYNIKKNNDNNLSHGYIQINETNNFYSNIKISNIKLSNANCKINHFNPSKIETNPNGENLQFDANITCSQTPSTLKITFDETANYIDTDIKSVKKTFSKEIGINSSNNSNNTIIGIADITPSSITINEGNNFTFYVHVFDKNNTPISTNVKINPPLDSNGNLIGEFDTYSFTTDKKGKGSFTYKAPTSINKDEINLTIPVTFDNNFIKNININIKKNFETTINPTKIILVPKSITINPGVSYDLKILTLDNDNRGISSTVTLSHPIDNNNNSWGTFDKYSIKTNENGEATVTFTAIDDISNLKNSLPVPIIVSSASLKDNLLLIKPSSSKKLTSYKIKSKVPDSIQIEKDFNINIQIVDNTDKILDESNITEINVSSENHLVYFDHNSSKHKTTTKNINNVNIISTTSKTAGIDIIDVNSTIDSNGTSKIISKQIPVVIISGPVRAISIHDIASNYDSSTGLFTHTYSIHAVDKYSNPVQAGTKITVGAVINEKNVSINGELKPSNGSNTSEFDDNTQNFDDDLVNNTLIIFANANHNNPLYLGGWIVDNVDSSTKLTLASVYNGSSATNLSYVIGDEKRYISCSDSLAVADFDSNDKTYTTNSSGLAIVRLRFDPDLIGKTISLFANSYQDEKVGISMKEVLLSNQGLTKEENEDSNATHNNGIWEKDGNNNDNKTAIITIGGKDGPYNTELGSDTILAKKSPISLKVLTPSICTINNKTKVDTSTDCNGVVSVDVNYSDDGICKIKFEGFRYEY
jgi:hypothetical protein